VATARVGWIGRRLRGRLGDGSANIKVMTVNGSISIRSL